MKKLVLGFAVLLILTINSYSQIPTTLPDQVAKKYLDLVSKDIGIRNEWEDGLRNSNGFELKKLDFSIVVLKLAELGNSAYAVAMEMKITAYCLDTHQSKRRVVSNRGVILLILDEPLQIINSKLVYKDVLLILNGWNEVDT